MGKDFIPLKVNGYNLEIAYNAVCKFKTISASNINLFYVKPDFCSVRDIEIGTDGTKECLITLEDGFIIVEGTIPVSELVSLYDDSD